MLSRTLIAKRALNSRSFATIAPGVDFAHIAREWRCKWSPDSDKKALADVQKEFMKVLPQVKGLPGLVSVQRVVCGGCQDFKVVMKFDIDHYKAWAGKDHKPEADFLASIKGLTGVSAVETQTYTLETL